MQEANRDTGGQGSSEEADAVSMEVRAALMLDNASSWKIASASSSSLFFISTLSALFLRLSSHSRCFCCPSSTHFSCSFTLERCSRSCASLRSCRITAGRNRYHSSRCSSGSKPASRMSISQWL